MKRPLLILSAVLVLATLVRAWAVVALPFEQDEIYTIHESRDLFETKIQPGIQARPLFYLMLHPIVESLPHTPLVLRALPFLFGLAGVVLTWVLCRRIAGRNAAAVATLLAALSSWHIGISSFSRYYSLLYLVAALVYAFLPRALDEDNPRDYLIVFAAMLVGFFTHPSFVFPVAAGVLVLMAFRADGRMSWRWPTANAWRFLWIPFVAIAGSLFVMIRVLDDNTSVDNGAARGLMANLRILPAIVEWIGPVLCVAALAGIAVMLSAGGNRRAGVVALAGGAATIAALMLLSFVTAIYADYAVSALPLVFLAIAALVQWFEDNAAPANRGPVAAALGALLVASMLPSTVSFLSDGSRFDYRPAYERIRKDSPQTAVLTWPLALKDAYAPELRAYEIPVSVAGYEALLARERDAWVVTSVKRYGIVGDDSSEISRWLSENCRMVDQYERARFDYRLYRVDLWRCTQRAEGAAVSSS